ncbi:MAG: trypsin-like peptidase domain-containing protein [Thermoguttaceae bacterium]
MVRRCGPTRCVWAGLLVGLFCLSLARPAAIAADDGTPGHELSALVARVDPCVVTIKMQHSQGSGFVVDAHGTIATNYHVIEGAKEATVVFPDKSTFAVKGFLAIIPNKDMALLHIETKGKQLPVLRFAASPPAKGERVFAFGAPLGMSGSVSEGIVAALRSGEDVRATLHEGSDKDIYTEVLGYDTQIQWIQTTTPISPGNSGGPLVNAQGEVVGINSWQSRLGQNVNFSISATHLEELMKHSGSIVQSLNMLPKSRHQESGDADKTLSVWKQLNRLQNELTAKVTPYEKRLAAIAPPDRRNPLKGLTGRLKNKAIQYHSMGLAYSDFAAKVKALKTGDIDPRLLVLTIAEADLAQRAGDLCEKIAAAGTAQSEEEVIVGELNFRQGFQRAAANLRTGRDLLRADLSLKFHKEFPTLEQTASQSEQDDKGETVKEEPKDQTGADRAELRNWSDSTGTYHIQARFRGIKDGKLSLERSDGKVIAIPVEKLSDADRRFIGEEK